MNIKAGETTRLSAQVAVLVPSSQGAPRVGRVSVRHDLYGNDASGADGMDTDSAMELLLAKLTEAAPGDGDGNGDGSTTAGDDVDKGGDASEHAAGAKLDPSKTAVLPRSVSTASYASSHDGGRGSA